uniref:Methyltransferase small domain-containing protein n=1 Tax=Alexandrium catenella TaxID=2925 RepID=A0A7S1WKY9_ALECA|mmetsp:Transcript_70050/g.186135  ORF Transcript_70050/g.186135 Transcript_70050/m.186135 type:complete len:424 (+) Transcript_70050:60-1331(+)
MPCMPCSVPRSCKFLVPGARAGSAARTPSSSEAEPEVGGCSDRTPSVMTSATTPDVSPGGQDRSMSPDGRHLELFQESLCVRSLPVVIFNDEATEQQVWHDGCVVRGRVQCPDGPPDVRACNPVVMSPAFLGFAIEPYESRYLHYKGVGIVFARPYGGRFMQPSIDTILVCRALATLFEEAGPLNVRRAIDIGSGSGFLGKFAAVHVPGSDELSVTLVDIDPKAMEYCQKPGFNASQSGHGGRRVSWSFRVEDAVSLLEADAQYDLILSNPPYIPTLAEARGAELSRPVSGFWEGVGLVVYLVELLLKRRCPAGAHVVIMVTSLTLKSPQVRSVLESAQAQGVRARQLVEREIAWKAWYAGPSGLDHLLATPAEHCQRQRVGECDFFVGATEPGNSRTGSDGRDRYWNYHWHVAYVLDLWAPA